MTTQVDSTGAVEQAAGENDAQGEQQEQVEQQESQGFPANTAVAEMTLEQQTAYWRNEKSKQQRKFEAEEKARKALEAELEDAKRAALSDAERAALEAREQVRKEAVAEAHAALLPKLAVAELRARGLTPEDAAERVEFLDLSKFVGEDGELVVERFDRLVPPPQETPPASFAQQFGAAGSAPLTQRTSLSRDAIKDRADQIKNKK